MVHAPVGVERLLAREQILTYCTVQPFEVNCGTHHSVLFPYDELRFNLLLGRCLPMDKRIKHLTTSPNF